MIRIRGVRKSFVRHHFRDGETHRNAIAFFKLIMFAGHECKYCFFFRPQNRNYPIRTRGVPNGEIFIFGNSTPDSFCINFNENRTFVRSRFILLTFSFKNYTICKIPFLKISLQPSLKVPF